MYSRRCCTCKSQKVYHIASNQSRKLLFYPKETPQTLCKREHVYLTKHILLLGGKLPCQGAPCSGVLMASWGQQAREVDHQLHTCRIKLNYGECNRKGSPTGRSGLETPLLEHHPHSLAQKTPTSEPFNAPIPSSLCQGK